MPSLVRAWMRPRNASRQSRSTSLWVPPLILRLVTWAQMSRSEPLVCSGVEPQSGSTRPVEHRQKFRLVGVQLRQQAIEDDEAGAAAEDTTEPGPQCSSTLDGRHGAIYLEGGVEPPDQRADARLGGAMRLGEGIELVHQPLGMHPAQRVPTTANWPSSSLTMTLPRKDP